MFRYCLAVFAIVGSFVAAVSAQEAKPADNAPKVTFDEHIKPIFREHCLSCHNQDQKKGGLSLDTYSAAMAGGSSGEVVLAGDVESSRLYALTSHREQPKMPPMQDKLAAGKLELLQKWIDQGALENSGSKAVLKKKKSTSLMSAPVGKGKPAVVAMPENLWRQPVQATSRAGTITALASSPWGPLVAIAGQRQIVLYNTDTLDCVGVLPYTEGIPYVLKFSRNGSVLMAGGGRGGHSGSVVLFDVKTGKRIAKIGDELDAVLAADINDTHTLVALGGPLKTVRIYSVESGEKLFEMKKHTDWIYAVEFSPDGVLLATTDRSGGVFVWEAATAREYLNLRGHNNAVYDVAWRPDSNVLATAGEDSTIRLWELNDGNQIKIWNAHAGGTFCLDYTHDGRLISAGRDKNVRTWTGDGTAIKAFVMADDAMRCTFSHDGKRLLGGDWAGNVKLWDAESGNEVALLVANPPTLAVRLEQTKAELARLQPLAQNAAAEFETLRKLAEDRNNQVKAATEKIAALEASAQKLEADRAAAAKVVEAAAATLKAKQDALPAIQASIAKTTDENTQAAQMLTEKTNAAKVALDQVTADKATADKLTNEQSADASAAVEKAKQAQAAAEKAEQDRAATATLAQQKAEELAKLVNTEKESVAALEAAKKNYEESAKRVADLTAQVQTAVNAVPPAKADMEARTKEKAEAEAQFAQKKPLVEAAQQSAQLAQQRVDQVAAELAAFSQAGTLLIASVEQAKQKADAFTAPLTQAENERLAAEKAVAEKAAATKALTDKIAALMAEQKALLDAQKQAEAAAAEKAKKAAEVKAAREAAEEQLEQAESNRRAFEEAYPKK